MRYLYIRLFLSVFALNTNAQIITTVVGNGLGAGTFTCCYSGDGGQATAAELANPEGIAFDAVGNMYISDRDNSRVRMINTLGIISTVAGIGTYGFSGDGGQATAAALYGPMGLAFDAVGNLYIADQVNFRIRIVNTAGIINTVVGGGSSGLGDGGQATNATLYYPEGLVFDASGNLYISDSWNNRIRKVNTLGIITTIAGSGASYPGGGYSGDGGQATAAELYTPTGITLDAFDNLYIADHNNNRIRRVNTVGTINTFAGNGYAAPAAGAYSGDGGAAIAAELFYPIGVTFDASVICI